MSMSGNWLTEFDFETAIRITEADDWPVLGWHRTCFLEVGCSADWLQDWHLTEPPGRSTTSTEGQPRLPAEGWQAWKEDMTFSSTPAQLNEDSLSSILDEMQQGCCQEGTSGAVAHCTHAQ